jgi:hypothetical protein
MYLHTGVIWTLEPFDLVQHTSIIALIHNFFRGSIFVASVPNSFYSIFLSHCGKFEIDTIPPMYVLWRLDIGWRNVDGQSSVF